MPFKERDLKRRFKERFKERELESHLKKSVSPENHQQNFVQKVKSLFYRHVTIPLEILYQPHIIFEQGFL